MQKFVNRATELNFLNDEFTAERSSFTVVYGRRRVGKTSLLREFIRTKRAIYFLAESESDLENRFAFARSLNGFNEDVDFTRYATPEWEEMLLKICDYSKTGRIVLVIDEYQYLCMARAGFSSVLQRIWDTRMQDSNIMLVLCGSLVGMMESETLNYGSPLYGRRTGQIRLMQIEYRYYHEFFTELGENKLIPLYSVTGGIPKYIEQFSGKKPLIEEITAVILNKNSLLYEEPIFLLENEVRDLGSYFSLLKTIAQGEHKIGKIATRMGVRQQQLTRHLETLRTLDLIERIVPVTEEYPEKSKKGLYFIKDNFIEFWFKFVYPYRSYLELGNIAYVQERLSERLIENHVSFVYEKICRENFRSNSSAICGSHYHKTGRWWDNASEIDFVALNEESGEIAFGECKYTTAMVDIDVYHELKHKAANVVWHNSERQKKYVIYGKNGFTKRLVTLAKESADIFLIKLG
ncbi:MAG: ATP-binding protein [Bacillota bacterium]